MLEASTLASNVMALVVDVVYVTKSHRRKDREVSSRQVTEWPKKQYG